MTSRTNIDLCCSGESSGFPRALLKHWSKESLAVIGDIYDGLALSGFINISFDVDSAHIFVQRELSDKLIAEIQFSPISISGKKWQFSSFIWISSLYVAKVINELRLWECAQLVDRSGLGNELETSQVGVLGVALEWLKWNAEPELGPIQWIVEPNKEQQLAGRWLEAWVKYGNEYIRAVDSVEKLVKFISNLSGFPKRVRPPGFRCPNRSQYLAILLSFLNMNSAAINEIYANLEEVRARVDRGECDPDAEALLRCKFARLRRYFLQS